MQVSGIFTVAESAVAHINRCGCGNGRIIGTHGTADNGAVDPDVNEEITAFVGRQGAQVTGHGARGMRTGRAGPFEGHFGG